MPGCAVGFVRWFCFLCKNPLPGVRTRVCSPCWAAPSWALQPSSPHLGAVGIPQGREKERSRHSCALANLCSVWRSSFRFLDRGRNRCRCVPAFSPTIECVLLTATRFYGDWLLSVCFWELLELRFEWAALLGKLFYENRTSHLQGCAVLHTTSPCSV